MSVPRTLASSALALLVPATLLAAAQPGSATGSATGSNVGSNVGSMVDPAEPPAASVSVRTTSRQRVTLQALPQVVQHGARPADADRARAGVTATIRPVRPGRRVHLHVRRGEAWETVTTTRQDARGRAQFAAAGSEAGDPLTYRVRAAAAGGLRAVTSGVVSTERWLDATWTDEFSGTHLGPEWSHRGRDYVGSNRRSCSKGDPSAASVGGGALRLSVVKDPEATSRCRIRGRDAVGGRFAYRLNGHVGTQGAFSFRYGVAAARVKFHRLRGQHGAFWLQPAAGMYPGATGSEIDVVEYFGDRHPQGGLASFVHRYDGRRRVSAGGWIPGSESFLASRRDGWSKNYHVFSVEWTPRSLVFRIDGKETGRMGRGVSDVRQFPILSLIAADYEIPKIQGRRLPQHMYVDWVRVWETGG
ncbi:glycoside hydrolase family 16 protein [Nocardioides sp. S-58]|uniref:Glycoside hydrolase family 16 protein n=1 Tax=Nocardioides renjunii TaxID=3095075 RepID=A0ABU5KC83_9ACTN|nr:glycoside hydrolase family 16 protein [Nocardioides sp. S-58]MDZ5662551.1 glycoside hydrolase family 16 protein [Nocardioides sp. S-58]